MHLSKKNPKVEKIGQPFIYVKTEYYTQFLKNLKIGKNDQPSIFPDRHP